jgi:hypothetical protein
MTSLPYFLEPCATSLAEDQIFSSVLKSALFCTNFFHTIIRLRFIFFFSEMNVALFKG